MSASETNDVKSFEKWFEQNADDGRRLWVFHHIRKTGGSSLAAEISRILRPHYNFALDARMSDRLDLSQDQREDAIVGQFIESFGQAPVRFANGHLHRRHILMLQEAIGSVSFFTFLREPFARLVSAFRYAQTDMHPSHQEFIETYPTFEAFLYGDDGEAAAERNAMCKYLTGNEDNPSFEEAREILEKEYAFCGIFEMYDLSFRTLTALMRSPRAPSLHERKTPAKVRNEIIDPDRYRDLALALNREDVELYRFVRDRLEGNATRLSHFIGGMQSSTTPSAGQRERHSPPPARTTSVLRRWLSNRTFRRQADYIRPFVDKRFYADAYGPTAAGDPAIHYVATGWINGFDPCPWFSTARYLEEHVDVAASGVNPFYHYLRFGRAEGRLLWPTDASRPAIADDIRRYDLTGLTIVLEAVRQAQSGHVFVAGSIDPPRGGELQIQADGADVATLVFFESRPDLRAPRGPQKFRLLAKLPQAQAGAERLRLCVGMSGSEATSVIDLNPRPVEASDEFSRLVAHALCNFWAAQDGFLQTALNWIGDVRAYEQRPWADAVANDLDRLPWSGARSRALVLARRHPHMSYLNAALLSMSSPQTRDIVLCLCGDDGAIDNSPLAAPNDDGPRFHRVVSDRLASSTTVIANFLARARRDGVDALVVLDDVGLAAIQNSVARALAEPSSTARAWAMSQATETDAQRQPPHIGALFAPAAAHWACPTKEFPPYFGRGPALDAFARAMEATVDPTAAIDLIRDEPRSDAEMLNRLLFDHSE